MDKTRMKKSLEERYEARIEELLVSCGNIWLGGQRRTIKEAMYKLLEDREREIPFEFRDNILKDVRGQNG